MPKPRIPFTVRNKQTSLQNKVLVFLIGGGVVPMAILLTAVAGVLDPDIAMLVAIACQIGGLALAYYQSNAICRQAALIGQAIDSFQQGDFESRTDVMTTDELGQAAEALNKLGDVVTDLSRSDEERKRIQSTIVELKSEIKQIAAGDLTISARAKSDLTGSIAESINQMTEQLRSIVKQVQSSAVEATRLTDHLQTASVAISQESESQAAQVHSASKKLVDLTDAFQNLSVLTEDSVKTAVEARQTATDGFQAVTATVDGMQRIRDQVQGTSKRIKQLGESSQEIGEIVQLISDITDKTSILALNASIQAAMAGDAGHGFAVVAEEIEQLAETGTAATKQISKLVRAIQNETSDVIADMEESTREVVAGSRLATRAGETLAEIDKVSSHLVELIRNASAYAANQAGMANQIAAEMSEIACSARESSEQTHAAIQTTSQLSETVFRLQSSCDQFQLTPASTIDPVGTKTTFRIQNTLANGEPRKLSWGSTTEASISTSNRPESAASVPKTETATARRVNPTMLVDSKQAPGECAFSKNREIPDANQQVKPPEPRPVAQTMTFDPESTQDQTNSRIDEYDDQLLEEVHKVQSELATTHTSINEDESALENKDD